ncbi:cyclin-D4-1-like [Chenopodium quinoa]|uniref:cyclin-D4-1-like n=1 Tax=Chenopodium quinoa TaxID=63459 RepID=UPI000B78470D|nr:cyclin-D4-1-like [Chenopodium quinoa]
MADIFLCDESKDFFFDDDLDDSSCGPIDFDHQSSEIFINHHHHHRQISKSQPLIVSPEEQSIDDDEAFASMVERESCYFPREDYLFRFRFGDLNFAARTDAFDWIFKAHSYYSFGPLSFCLAVNYLDRFLSTRELPSGKAWAVQLLAVACLSIAAKLEETSVPQSVEFQVEDPKFVFEAKTIKRMELMVLDTLNWKMNAVTPCSFIDYSLKKLCDYHNDNFYLSSSSNVVNRSMQLISSIIRGIDFLEFKPSEIAAAVAISVTAEIQSLDIDKACSCFIHLDKGRVKRCVDMIKENAVNNRNGNVGVVVVPQSPIGVLEAGCFSYKSDELTTTTTTTVVAVGSCANSSQITGIKRKKLDTSSSSPKLDS